MSEILTDVLGDNYAFVDYTWNDSLGGPRNFNSFEEAANEAAISRLYGGIHFSFGNNAGLQLGKIVGENVNEVFEQVNVSTKETKEVASTQVFPNPASDFISINSVDDLNETKYRLADMHGKLISEGFLTRQNRTLSLASLHPGVYLLQINEENVYRIVKN